MIETLFSCIGAQKAGTTWLHSVLSKDERLSFPRFVKETHYFSWLDFGDNLVHRWRANQVKHLAAKANFAPMLSGYLARISGGGQADPDASGDKLDIYLRPIDDAWYERLFPVPDGICVDITPAYARMSADGFRRMESVARNTALLFLLRDPVERSWSGLLQAHKGKLDAAGLQEKFARMDHRAILNALARPSVAIFSDYQRTFDAVASAGMSTRLHVAFYDSLKDNPAEIIEVVYRVLGLQSISFSDDVLAKVVYRSPEVSIPDSVADMLIERYRPMVKVLGDTYCTLPKSWRNKYGI